MKASNHALAGGLAATTLIFLSCAAQAEQGDATGTILAQTTNPPASSSPAGTGSGSADRTAGRTSYGSDGTMGTGGRPYYMGGRSGYVGLSLGASDYDVNCGGGGPCDEPDVGGKVFTGGMFDRFFGLELAYLNLGWTERGAARSRAQGVNLSLVGRIPLHGDRVALFAKGGGTYGRTNTVASPGSGIVGGSENGFGASFGAGFSFQTAPNWGVVVEWERHRFDFAGDNREWVDFASVGLKYQF